MKQSEKNIVIVGGGLSGLYSALLISDQFPKYQVHLIERAPHLGGTYTSIHDSQMGWLDIGMHTIPESGIEEVDRYIREALDENGWNFLTGNKKDISGIFYRGVLHEESPYINLRDLPAEIQPECLADFVLQVSERNIRVEDCATAHDFFARRFGRSIADRVIEPVLNKLWNTSGSNLDAMASRSVLMDRVRLFDSETMVDIMKSDLLRPRVAFPKQMDLPLEYRSKLRCLYPKQFGMIHLIQAIEKKLLDRGVKFYTSAQLGKLLIENQRIKSVEVTRNNESVTIDGVKMLHWSGPILGIAPLLDIDFPLAKLDPPNAQVYVYLFLKQKPRIGDLYYFYCLDSGYQTYRVTSFASYCPNAKGGDGAYPVCVELQFRQMPNQSEAELTDLAVSELIAFGVIDSVEDVGLSRVEKLKTGFPILTLNNSRMMAELRNQIGSRGITNLVAAGQAPERGVFFLNECLKLTYHSVNQFMGDNK